MKTHVCKQCGKAYKFDGLLQRHKCKSGVEEHIHFDLKEEQSQAVHERKKLHKCPICKKNFASKKFLIEHALTHSNEENSGKTKVRFFISMKEKNKKQKIIFKSLIRIHLHM